MSSSTTERSPAWWVLAIGLVGGLLSGLVGVGGGIVLVPLMVGLLAMRQHRAHGTSLAIIIPTALSATVPYALAAPINWMLAVALAGPAVVFAIVGARLTKRLNAAVLRRLFAVLLLLTAGRLGLSALFSDQNTGVVQFEGITLVAVALGAGAFTGIVSGTMGVGGGIVMVPVMVLIMGIPQHMAQGISLAAIVPIAVAGTLQHMRMGNVNMRYALLVSLGGIVGGAVGAQTAQVLAAPVLRLIFAIFAVYSAQRMFGVQAWVMQRLRLSNGGI